MDPRELFSLAVTHSGEAFEMSRDRDPERYSTIEIWGTWNGHDVKFLFTDTATNPAQYRYNVSTYEGDTGEPIATGNGGPTWADAFGNVHWQNFDGFNWLH